MLLDQISVDPRNLTSAAIQAVVEETSRAESALTNPVEIPATDRPPEDPSTQFLFSPSAEGKQSTSLLWNISVPPTEWSPSLEKKFSKLVMKKATGKLTKAETERLEQMKLDRRALLSPRRPLEVALEYERWAATEALMKALDRYVKVQTKIDASAGRAGKIRS